MPAHVTILSPFLDSSHPGMASRSRGQALATVAGIVAGMTEFEVSFKRVMRWAPSDYGPGVVWLQPDPADPFVNLTRAIWRAFPEAPPYGRLDDGLEAHLTIAIDDPARFDRAAVEASAHVPFVRQIASASLVAEGESGEWRTVRRFRFGRRSR